MKNLQRIRKDNGMTQTGLAEESGVPYRTIRSYERGENDINKAEAMTVYKLANALGAPMEDLLEFDGEENK